MSHISLGDPVISGNVVLFLEDGINDHNYGNFISSRGHWDKVKNLTSNNDIPSGYEIIVIEEGNNTYFYITFVVTDMDTNHYYNIFETITNLRYLCIAKSLSNLSIDLNSDCFKYLEKSYTQTMIRYIFRNTTIMEETFFVRITRI